MSANLTFLWAKTLKTWSNSCHTTLRQRYRTENCRQKLFRSSILQSQSTTRLTQNLTKQSLRIRAIKISAAKRKKCPDILNTSRDSPDYVTFISWSTCAHREIFLIQPCNQEANPVQNHTKTRPLSRRYRTICEKLPQKKMNFLTALIHLGRNLALAVFRLKSCLLSLRKVGKSSATHPPHIFWHISHT